MTNSLTKTARWPVFAVCMGLLATLSLPGKAAIYWPNGTGNVDTEPSKEYTQGYKKGQKDCVGSPVDCGVMLEDVVANPGWGETEPNDHIGSADYLRTGIFYKGNSMDAADRDWYFIDTDRPNQNLVVSFLGDQANYTNTAGWIISVHDSNGNVIASFDSTSSGVGNVSRYEDDEMLLAKIPLSLAKVLVHTLGNAGRYYISVASNGNGGVQRGYHIAAMISRSDQIAPNPDTNFSDAETEVNDTRGAADPLRSNVHMFGTFGRRMVKLYSPPEPARYEIKAFYVGCDPMDVSTIPLGLDSCECDPTSVDENTGNIVPPNPNTTDQTPFGACEQRSVQVPGTGTDNGTWNYAYDYDNDWFFYTSDGNEQLKFEMCAKGQCDFARVHLRVLFIDDSVVLIDGPIKPGQVFDFGVASAGTYYFELSPEPTDGPEVDPDSGIHTVDDLTGPYNFVLRSTGMPTNGGN